MARVGSAACFQEIIMVPARFAGTLACPYCPPDRRRDAPEPVGGVNINGIDINTEESSGVL